MFRRHPPLRWLALVVGMLGSALVACQPSIGDTCQLSTDCSRRGDRLCDTSQPEGYCTLFNCYGESCPDDSVCVQFAGTIPGCTYDDRRPSRVGRSMCLAPCTDDSDCRVGYVCRAPGDAPYGAKILKSDKSQKVCLVAPVVSVAQASDAGSAPVCSYSGPDLPPIDAGTASPADAGSVDAGTDAKNDASPADGGAD